MESLLGFQLDAWDFATFGALAIIGAGFIVLLYLVLGLPGRIAIARNHPEAEAVNMMGWLGFLGGVSWMYAFIWSLKPSYVVDIRDLPQRRRHETEEEIARLTGKPATVVTAAPPVERTPA
jgi:hypothetical protein